MKAEVLKWARESSGWTVQEVSTKLKVPPRTYKQWETTGLGIRLTQLEALAKHYKRPLAAFFLPKPPKEPKPPRDFRVLPGREGKFEKKTLLAIRRGIRLQTLASELGQTVDWDTKPRIGTARLQDDPEVVSVRERERLGINTKEQLRWRNESEALQHWRDAVEKQNVLAFSISMPVDDSRGFSLSELRPWAVVLNASDAMRARIFTLFHEYAHLLLRSPGVCIPQQEWTRRAGTGSEERWCNHFAAALLLPAQTVQMISSTSEFVPERLPESLWVLSQRFKVSQEVVLRRLLTLGLVSQREFWKEIERLQSVRMPKRKGGFAAPALLCVRGNGRLFTRLVLEGRERGAITYANVADYLGVRLKHLEKVQSLVAA